MPSALPLVKGWTRWREALSRKARIPSAGQQALGAVAGVVRREAYVMAYGDCFFLIGAVLLAMVLLVWLCRGTEREHVAGLHGSNGLGPRHAGAPTARVGRYLSQRAVLIPG